MIAEAFRGKYDGGGQGTMETMPEASPLDLKQFVVKEHVGFLKLADVFDIYDASTQAKIALAKETPGGFMTFLRFLVNKKLLPNLLTVTQGDENGPRLLSIRKPFTFLRTKLWAEDGSEKKLGYFKSKTFSFSGGLRVHDEFDRQVAEVKGDWKGWNFKFLSVEGKKMGRDQAVGRPGQGALHERRHLRRVHRRRPGRGPHSHDPPARRRPRHRHRL